MARSIALLGLCISLFLPTQTFAGNLGGSYNGLANTPQMGWDNWNAFGCNINETLFLDAAQKIVDYGYVAHAMPRSPLPLPPASHLSSIPSPIKATNIFQVITRLSAPIVSAISATTT